jgi:hypothetical protein
MYSEEVFSDPFLACYIQTYDYAFRTSADSLTATLVHHNFEMNVVPLDYAYSRGKLKDSGSTRDLFCPL